MNHIKILFVENNLIFWINSDNKVYKELFEINDLDKILLKYLNLIYKEKSEKLSKSFIKSIIKMSKIENGVITVNQNKTWYRQRNYDEYNRIRDLYLDSCSNNIILKDLLKQKSQDNNIILKELEYAVKNNPNDDYALFKYGVALADFGKFDDAVDYIREAISLNEDKHDYYYHLSLAYKKNRKFELAISEIISALEKDPENYNYIKTLAELYFESNKYKESLDAYNEILHNTIIPPEDMLELQIRVGFIYNKLGYFDDAILLFSDILSSDNNNQEAKQGYEGALEIKKKITSADVNNLGIAYAEKNKYDKAIEKFKKAIEINSNDSEFYFNLAMAYKKSNLLIQSSLEFKNALKINDNLYEAYIELADIYQKQNNITMAIEEYKKFIEKSNDLVKIEEIKKLLDSLKIY